MAVTVISSPNGRYKAVVGTKQEIVDYIELNETNNIGVMQIFETDAALDKYTIFLFFS